MKHDYFDEQDGMAVNPSNEPTIAELIDVRLSRRGLLKGMAAGGAFGLFGCATGSGGSTADGSASLTFTEIPRTTDDKAHVAPGYNAQVLIGQGDPIRRGAPAYRPGQQTGSEQELQFGTDADFISYMPLPLGSKSSTRGLLGVNHENCRQSMVFPGNPRQLTRQQCEVQMAAVGFTIVEIA
ncbi:MAG: alkaline phosphatase PhoX, partial [Burkholderiales bacterium]